MTYRRDGRYWVGLRLPAGYRRVSTGTGDRALAQSIEATLRRLAEAPSARNVALLLALVDRRLTAQALYLASREKGGLDAARAALDDLDLEPLVADWHRSIRAQKSADGYLAQVRRLIPDGAPYPRSRFTRRVVQQHLDHWASPTRNRHRTALSLFARWLMATEVLEMNPVRDTIRAKERAPRLTAYTVAESKRVLGALSQPFRALEALMCGTSAEWGACQALTRADVDRASRTVRLRGTKTVWRDRTVRIAEDWCWAPFWAHARACIGGARLFPFGQPWALHQHHEAVKAVGLPQSTLHDWRHSFAVRMRLAGEPDWKIAAWLGHRDTTLVAKVYGRFQPTESQLRRRAK